MKKLARNLHTQRGLTWAHLLWGVAIAVVVVLAVVIIVKLNADDPRHAALKPLVRNLCDASLPPPDGGTFNISQPNTPPNIERDLGSGFTMILSRRVDWKSSLVGEELKCEFKYCIIGRVSGGATGTTNCSGWYDAR